MTQKNKLLTILRCKCPRCNEGELFVQKGLLPIKHFVDMHSHCPQCGQKFKGESNNGPGINFALTTILFFGNIIWYYPLFGISAFDDSIYYFMAASIFVTALMQPYLMRLSRSIYLYFFLSFRG